MNNTICSCNSCGFSSFTTNQAYQRHLQTNKHKLRQENTRKDLFQCKKCNKWYCGKTGLSHHKNICTVSQIPIPEKTPTQTISIQEILLRQDLKHEFEKEIQVMKKEFEKERQVIKQELEESMKEQINKILKKHTRTMNHTNSHTNSDKQESTSGSQPLITQPQHQKSRDKRKKINNVVRQQIVEKQQNTCGECKQLLSLPYFQLDHIIGLQFGGTDEESNLMALCGECHNIKSICENRHKKDIQEYIHSIWKDKRRSGITESRRVSRGNTTPEEEHS